MTIKKIYDELLICHKCQGKNYCKIIDNSDGIVNEAETKCEDCGWDDYWAYGHFQAIEEN